MPLEARGPVGLRVERGRGAGLQGSGVTFGALVTTGGLQGGPEGKRNTRQTPGRGGPRFLGRPFSR